MEDEDDLSLANDDSDVEEEEIRQYDEHFWCKEQGIPVGFTYKSKKQDFIRACEIIKSNFSKNSNFNQGNKKDKDNDLSFRVLDHRNRENGPEMDIEVIKNKERGSAVLKFYGPNSKSGECTVMINKSKRHDAKFVKMLAIDIIKRMLDTFIRGEDLEKIFKKENRKLFRCNPCSKTFASEKNLNTHTEKFHADIVDINGRKNIKEHMSTNHTKKELKCKVCKEATKDKKSFNEHIRIHETRVYECEMCKFTTKNENQFKEHIEHTHKTKNKSDATPVEESDRMEVDESEQTEIEKSEEEKEGQERAKRSEMQDKKIIENQRKQEEIDVKMKLEKEAAEQKEVEENRKRKEEEAIERRKRKASIKQQKKVAKKKLNKLPPGITEIPDNLKHLVDKGDLQLLIPPDGACAPNAGAAHLFKDPKFGPNFRMLINKFIVDRWDFYKEKIPFPYVRKVGVKGENVRFEIGEEENFQQFLKSKQSAYLWSDSEDLHVMANLYQMRIQVITTKGTQDTHPTVNWIGPDEELSAHKMLPEGTVKDMRLIHYDDCHYNLIISKDDDIALYGALSEYLASNREEEKLMEEHKEKDENETLEEKTLIEEYKKSQDTIEKMKRRISYLEKELSEKSDELKEVIETLENVNEFEIVQHKKNGYTRKGPQVESIKTFNKNKYDCKMCNATLEAQESFNIHMKNHKDKESQVLKELKSVQASKNNIEKEYFLCEKELRNKTEELEKCKIENKDLRTIVELREQVRQKEDDRFYMEVDEEENSDKNGEFDKTSPQSKSTPKKVNEESSRQKLFRSQCGLEAKNRTQIRQHINTKHNEDKIEITDTEVEFNCMGCDFQGTSEKQLQRHTELKHMIKCKACEQSFKEKKNLMLHRKKEHPNLVAPCKKLAEKSCIYTEESCYWRHTVGSKEEPVTNCYICGNAFKSKSELMQHRKKEHSHTVKVCEKFKEGRCRFVETFCWFKHYITGGVNNIDDEGTETEENIKEKEEKEEEDSVFQKDQKKLKPPLKKQN